MNAIVKATTPGEIMETVLIRGDLSKLTTDERLSYYKAVCESVGLNALTKPFEYITLNGKLQLYALKACTDQLRSIHDISVTDLTKETINDVHIVTAKVQNSKGRTDADIGAVNIGGLKGEAFANAIMKAGTKAKRRATLSICGLGMLDETEVDDIPSAQKSPVPSPSPSARPRVPSPSASTPVVTVAPFELNTVGRKFPEWTQEYIGYIAKAETEDRLYHWDNLNTVALDAINAQQPVLYAEINAAVAKRVAEIQGGAAPKSVPTAKKDDPISSGKSKARHPGIPDIATDYTGWVTWALQSIAKIEDAGELETFFAKEVEAFKADIFPSDYDDCVDAYTKAQGRLNVDE